MAVMQASTIPSVSRFLIQNVIVPLDHTECSRLALPVATALSELQHSTLHFVYVGERLTTPMRTLRDLGLSSSDLPRGVVHCATGDRARAILMIAAELPNTLVVMCTHTLETSKDSLGRVTEAVLDAAPQRIVLMTPGASREGWTLRRILLAHDGSPSSDTAVLPVADLAERSHAEVMAVHVAAHGARRPDELAGLLAPLYIDQPQHEWPSWTGEFVHRMLALGGEGAISFRLLVSGGQPGSEIAHLARDNNADLVVLPWRGKWTEQKGGAVDAVVRRAACPVLLFCTTSPTTT